MEAKFKLDRGRIPNVRVCFTLCVAKIMHAFDEVHPNLELQYFSSHRGHEQSRRVCLHWIPILVCWIPILVWGLSDACHMHFGKYTLFSAYGSTANRSMAPVAFAILFSNENKESWGKFWKFVSIHYPSLNHASITFITDQDKGETAAIKEYMPNAHRLHCSWHRANNDMLACKMGRKLYSGFWYNTSSSSSDASQQMRSNALGTSIKTRFPILS